MKGLVFFAFPVLLILTARVPGAHADSPPPPSPGAEPAEPPDLHVWLEKQRDSEGRACERRAVAMEGKRILIACAEAGLWSVTQESGGGFRLLATEDLGGAVIGLFARGGRTWVEISRLEARPVSASPLLQPGDRGAPPQTAPARPEPAVSAAPQAPARPSVPSVRHGKVVEVRVGEVIVNLGSADGVWVGDSLEFAEDVVEELGGESAVHGVVSGSGSVVSTAEHHSRVQLGMNMRVAKGALARVVQRQPTHSRVAPQRAGGLWEVAFMARPFLALEDLGGGVLGEASVGYRFESPAHVKLALSPVGFGTAKNDRTILPFNGYVEGSYDSGYFEVGLGLGAQSVHAVTFDVDPGSGTLLLQHVRLGARDGLHLDLRNEIVLFHSEFQFSSFVGAGQIPIGSSSWLLLRGGGGRVGYGYGELAVRVLLRGNGDRGSFFFTGSVGGLLIYKDRWVNCGQFDVGRSCLEESFYAGPMLGAGGEWRL